MIISDAAIQVTISQVQEAFVMSKQTVISEADEKARLHY